MLSAGFVEDSELTEGDLADDDEGVVSCLNCCQKFGSVDGWPAGVSILAIVSISKVSGSRFGWMCRQPDCPCVSMVIDG